MDCGMDKLDWIAIRCVEFLKGGSTAERDLLLTSCLFLCGERISVSTSLL